jgi:hypothetical protein
MKAFLITLGVLLGSLPLWGQVQLYKLPEPKGLIRVKLVPLGNVPAADVYVVKRAIEGYYMAVVTVSAPLAIPAKVGVNGRSKSIRIKNGRKQVVTDSTNLQDIMIGYLVYGKEKEFDKIVGITTYGITPEKDEWSIRGITDAASSCLVV